MISAVVTKEDEFAIILDKVRPQWCRAYLCEVESCFIDLDDALARQNGTAMMGSFSSELFPFLIVGSHATIAVCSIRSFNHVPHGKKLFSSRLRVPPRRSEHSHLRYH